MTRPDFLIIGAMKSATTSLHRDLATHPGLFFGNLKEPDALSDAAILKPSKLDRYEALYAGALPGQLVGDASTGYTKLPEVTGVPERALQVLGPDIKIIYSVREPIARARSHHHHLLVRKQAPHSFEDALAMHPDIRDIGLYGMQLGAWLSYFPRQQVKIVRFEDYASDPAAVLNDLLRFLGVEENRIEPGPPENVAAEVHLLVGAARSLSRSRLWRVVRPLVPTAPRQRLKQYNNPMAGAVPDPPTEATRETLAALYAEDSRRLAELMGEKAPTWP